MILILGPSGSGKSTLVEVLSSLQTSKLKSSSKVDVGEFDEPPSPVATIGTNLTTLSIGKRTSVEIRELGGSMAPLWKSYYKDSRGIIFVIDASNVHQLSCASIQFKEIITSPDTQRLPILVVFNKIDIPSKTNINEVKYLSQISVYLQSSSQKVTVLECSCRDKTRLNDIFKWLQLKSVAGK